MNFISKKQFSAISLGLAMAAGASIANAGAIATAYLDITSLTFKKVDSSGSSDVLLGTDISAIGTGINNSGDTAATLNGVTDNNTGSAGIGIGAFDVGTSTLGNTGFSCVGDCGSYSNFDVSLLDGGTNPGFLVSPSDVPAGSYVVNDIGQIGSAIDVTGSGTVGSDAFALAESALVPGSAPGNIGSSQGNVKLLADFRVESNFTGDLEITFDWESYLRAALLGDMEPGSLAEASAGWQMTVVNEDTGAVFGKTLGIDDGFLGTVSTGVLGTDRVRQGSGTVSFASSGNFFRQGEEYSITISHEVTADSTAIPAPASLGLLSLGLLGLGAVTRRRARRD